MIRFKKRHAVSLLILSGFLCLMAALLFSRFDEDKAKVRHYRKGLIFSQRGRHTDAVKEYKKALDIDPKMSEAHFELGRSYGNLHHYERATHALNTAMSLNSALTLDALSELAGIYSLNEQLSVAETMCERILAIDPDNINAMAFLARLDRKAGRNDEARAWFERVLETDPAHVESLLGLSELAMLAGDNKAAEDSLTKIIAEIDPGNVSARMQLAKIYRFSNRTDKAIETLQEMLEKSPGSAAAHGALAEAYFSRGLLQEARREAETFLRASPGNTEGQLLLGAVSLKQRDYETAVTHLTKAANSPDASARAQYLLGLALQAQKMPAQAMSAFKKALAMDPSNVEYRLALAWALLSEGSFEKSQQEAMSVLATEPENEQAKQLLLQAAAFQRAFEQVESLLAAEGMSEARIGEFQVALKAFRAGQLETAEALCQQLTKSIPNSPLPWNLLGLVHLKRNEIEKALTCFQHAIHADSKFAASYVNIANIYMAIGSHEQAAREYGRAADMVPRDQAILMRSARGLAQMRYFDDAEEILRQKAEEMPDRLGFRLTLAELLLSTNRYADAQKELEHILALNPAQKETTVLHAECLARKGDVAAALRKFDELIGNYPEDTNLQAKRALCCLALCQDNCAEEWRAVAALTPGQSTDLSELARSLVFQEGEETLNDAEESLTKLQSNASSHIAPALMLANTRALLKEYDGIQDVLNQATSLTNAFKQSYTQLLTNESISPDMIRDLSFGVGLAHVQWRLPAIEKLGKIAKNIPPNASLYEMIGGLWEREGRPDEAIASYQFAISADAQYWPAHYRLGILSLNAGKGAEAEVYLRNALKHNPDSLMILIAMARAFEMNGKDDEAIAAYQKLNALHPDLPSVTNNLAWLLADKPSALNEALQYARSAVDLQPSKAEFRDTLGWIHFQLKDYEEARQQLDKAVFLNPANPSIRYHRGMAYFMLGDKTMALEEFKKAGETATAFPERQRNEDMLRKLT